MRTTKKKNIMIFKPTDGRSYLPNKIIKNLLPLFL